MSAENYDVFFNPGVQSPEAPGKNTTEYSPSADKGKGGVYQSIIRFIPWWQDPKHGSIQEKWVSYLVDPLTNKGRYIDCPSSVNKPSPLSDIYWKLKKSESVQMQKLAQNFSRRQSFSSLVQVIRDENNPELEGKILIYRYGKKIWEKINAELKPVIGESDDPFDILQGKVFALIVTKVSGFNNYDQSKFIDSKRIPLCIPDANGKLVAINAQTDKKMVFEWVKTNSPDLSKYAYKEWDQDTYDYVNSVILSVTGEGQVSNKYAGIVNNTSAKTDQFSPKNSNITVSDINLDNGFSATGFNHGLDDLDLNLPESSDSKGLKSPLGNLDDIMKGL